MSTQRIQIKLPITKTYFITFLNNYISIYFFNDQSLVLESLKNILFPPELEDKDFSDLAQFIRNVFNDLIKSSKPLEVIQKDLEAQYEYDVDIINTIASVVNSKRNDILNHINSVFNDDKHLFKNLSWSTKSILSASKEDYYSGKYADLEFSYCAKEVGIEQKSITFTKEDVNLIFTQMMKIKDNLNKINSIK